MKDRQFSSSTGHLRWDNIGTLCEPESQAPAPIPPIPTSQVSNDLGAKSMSSIMPDNNSDLLQLQHYAPSIHDIIECAKKISHCNIASVNSFPLCWDPQKCHQSNANITRQLLECSRFLKHGVDKESHTNNLTHPTLSGLIIDFFYTSANAMANLFLEIFWNEVPHAAIVFATTAIKVALDEVVSEGKDLPFKQNVYMDVYVDLLRLMDKCNVSPVHCTKRKLLHMQWAKIRRNGDLAGTTSGFDVNLD
ncbi:hypothetical protein V8B97DRAFT_2023551 [Scleroderma yunnanense]